MTTYEALRHLANALAPIAASGAPQEQEMAAAHGLFWSAVPEFTTVLITELSGLLKSTPLVHSVEFHYRDPYFRGGAAAVVIFLKMAGDADLLLRAECLIDRGTAGISVQRRPDDRSPAAALAAHVERYYRPGTFEAALSDLRPFQPRSQYWR